ncbi:MAG: cytidine deaminase [Anaerolineae bacterium]|nr:cytidine deaminase [Anaerolineae bacterium]
MSRPDRGPVSLSDETRRLLIAAALDARARAYAPYSHYAVGAALLARDNRIFGGCNIENASFGGTICAERTALVKAISEGEYHFRALAVVTENGGAPCGICRQMLYEFAPDLLVIIADETGRIHHEMPLRALLPLGFGPDELPDNAR